MSIDTALQRVAEINARLDNLGGVGTNPELYTWRNFDAVLANAQNRFQDGPTRLTNNVSYDSGFQAGSVGGSNSSTGIGTLRSRGRMDSATVGGPSGRALTPKLAATIERIAGRYGVPAALVKAVARAESGFNPGAVSHAGAQGMMQLMPATAKGLGVTDPFDAEQSIEGGTRYLRNALKLFDGDVTLAVASYNAGVGAVRRAGNEVPDIPETQTYVRRVLAYARDYGLDVPS